MMMNDISAIFGNHCFWCKDIACEDLESGRKVGGGVGPRKVAPPRAVPPIRSKTRSTTRSMLTQGHGVGGHIGWDIGA